MNAEGDPSRREIVRASALALASSLAYGLNLRALQDGTQHMIVCFIRYQIDPFQLDAFRKYAENWSQIIPRCGGHLIGYFLPHEGTNDIAWGLIGLESLAAYERYRERLRADPEARENFLMAQTKRLVLREERTFLDLVEGNSPRMPSHG